VLNSTTSVVIEALEQGLTLEEGIERARALGITETDPACDLEGWDAASKAAALANVLMDAGITPQAVDARGIGHLTPKRVGELGASGKTVRLVSRARRTSGGVRVRVRAEVLRQTDLLAAVKGTSNLLLVHTDVMGTLGTLSVSPGLEQTAYGLFSDLVDIARGE
jgi:homoserine dehydrogenase